MAQVKLLKIGSDGVATEFASASDEITLASFTAGAGPVMSATGIDMNDTDLSDIQDLVFLAPSTATINQTAGNLVIDNIMAKERNNVMTSAGAILFPVVTDSAGQLDSFKLPHVAGAPTATPAFSSDAGYMVYDSTNAATYVWTGSAWDNMNTVSIANSISDSYTAEEALSIRDAVYISSADNVSIADNSTSAKAQVLGFAKATTLITDPVEVHKFGVLTGFTGLTAGARYYLSSTPGAVTATVPSGSGATITSVGFAKSATALDVVIQSLGRRA